MELVNNEVQTKTEWIPGQRLIVTTISGLVSSVDVSNWEYSLTEVFSSLEDNSTFKIMVDLYGFKAADFEAHKKFRVVIPGLLANYGWRVGYLDLFPEAEIILKTERGIRCVAAVHVHQDESKIRLYQEKFGSAVEYFTTDPVKGKEWIERIAL